MTKKRVLAVAGAAVLALTGCTEQPAPPDRAIAPEPAATQAFAPRRASMGDRPAPVPDRNSPAAPTPDVVTTVTVPPVPRPPAQPVAGRAARPAQVQQDTASAPPLPDATADEDAGPGDDVDVDVDTTTGDDTAAGTGPGPADGLRGGPRCTRRDDHRRTGHRVGRRRCR
ncbi:hypothetical protein AB0C12_41290 [Actinoplanes sp. NPDC048967]|uniref:hypothetical protein n=1 Tax=Actinoplanes sp. NPDC048967 TaxID=3155269 RepID=UPI0033F9AF0D